MRSDIRVVLPLSLLVLLLNPCALQRAEQDNSLDPRARNNEVDQDVPAEDQPQLSKHDTEDGSDLDVSNTEARVVRFGTTHVFP